MWIIVVLLLSFFTMRHMDVDDEEFGRRDVRHLKRRIRR